MKHLQAFLLLAARPAVFVWGALGAVLVWVLTYAVGDPDFPLAPGDGVFAAAFGYPLMAGVLAGLMVQELQHCWFSWTLPGGRWKSALGFTAGGLLFTLLVDLLLSSSGTGHGPAVLVAVGISAYCLGGALVVPRARGVTFAGVSLVLAVWLFSATIGGFCATHQGVAVGFGAAITTLCLGYRFGSGTARRMPFLPAAELAGSFTAEHLARNERDKRVRRGPRRRRRWHEPLGSAPPGWLRAGLYESFGAIRPRDLLKLLLPLTWPASLVVLHTAAMRERVGWLAALAETTYRILFMPPDLPVLAGDKTPYEITPIFIAAAGLVLFVQLPRVFDSLRPYPLSRSDLARLTYRLYAVLALAFFLVVTVGLLLVGLAAGWWAGVELRLGFVPLFLRAALVTVLLLPIPQWILLRTRPRPPQNAFAGLVVGFVAFVAGVTFWSIRAASLPLGATTELLLLLALAASSQALFRRKVREHFATADLV
jgi:hypothetical protein